MSFTKRMIDIIKITAIAMPRGAAASTSIGHAQRLQDGQHGDAEAFRLHGQFGQVVFFRRQHGAVRTTVCCSARKACQANAARASLP